MMFRSIPNACTALWSLIPPDFHCSFHSRRRTAGQEWQASGFADPPSGRRRKSDHLDADSDVPRPPNSSRKSASGDVAPAESGTDGEEMRVEDADVSHGGMGMPLGKSSEISTAHEVGSGIDCSLPTGAASSWTSLTLVCPSDASPMAAGDALSPIDNVLSRDASGAAGQLEMSPQSFALSHQRTEAPPAVGDSGHTPSALQDAIVPAFANVAPCASGVSADAAIISGAAAACEEERGGAGDSGDSDEAVLVSTAAVVGTQ